MINAVTVAQSLDWKGWLEGAVGATVSGSAVVLSGYAIGVSWKKVGAMALVSAVVSLGKYLQQHPIPGAA